MDLTENETNFHVYDHKLLSDLNESKIIRDQSSPKVIFVLDTNILISNLTHLKEITSKQNDKTIFSIPWVVLQELDRLKSRQYSNSDRSIGSKAQNAIKFINSVLSEKFKNFIFENSVQVNQIFEYI